MLKTEYALKAMHRDAIVHSLHFLKQQPWSSSVTLLVIAVTLMLAAFCAHISLRISDMQVSWQNANHVTLYLSRELSSDEQQVLLHQVQTLAGVAHATFVSPTEGLTMLSQQEGMENIAEYLPNNPLPAVITVMPNPDLSTPEALEHLQRSLQSLAGVSEAKLDKDWIERLYTVFSLLTHISRGFLLLLALTVILVIGNTLRLIIFHRQDEIHILQSLGASDAFILRPFLYSGIWYGLWAACLAIVLADGVIGVLRRGISQWSVQYGIHINLPLLPISLIIMILLSASLLGWLAANLTVKYYLHRT